MATVQHYLDLGSIEAIIGDLTDGPASNADVTNAIAAITIQLARNKTAPPKPSATLLFWRDLLRIFREVSVALTTVVAIPIALAAIVVSVTQRIILSDTAIVLGLVCLAGVMFVAITGITAEGVVNLLILANERSPSPPTSSTQAHRPAAPPPAQGSDSVDVEQPDGTGNTTSGRDASEGRTGSGT